MTPFEPFIHRISLATRNGVQAFFKASHNGFALLGLAIAFLAIAMSTQPTLRRSIEFKATAWLQDRQFNLLGMDIRPDAVERATAVNPKDLPKEQSLVAYWLSQKYRVAPEPLGALVAEAYQVGAKVSVEPTLILAIMAVESGFNPFAQSSMGAQGLMQVMTSVHVEKYESFGGIHAAFDPVTNLRVGVRVLQDCIRRAGSIEGGLRQYVGATTPNDGGYVNKVMSEFGRLQQVAAGKSVPVYVPQQVAAIQPPAEAAAASPVLVVSEPGKKNPAAAAKPLPAAKPRAASFTPAATARQLAVAVAS